MDIIGDYLRSPVASIQKSESEKPSALLGNYLVSCLVAE